MKTLQEVHDMLVLTGYKDEADAVYQAIQLLEISADAIDAARAIFNKAISDMEDVLK